MLKPGRNRHFECRLCHESGSYSVFIAREMMYGLREMFDYVHCLSCGCLQLIEIPGDLGRHYPADYYSQLPRDKPVETAGLKGAMMRWYCGSASLRPDSKVETALRARLPMPTVFAEFGHYLIEARLRSRSCRILDVGCGSSAHRLAAFKRCGFDAVESIDPFIPADVQYHVLLP